MEKVSENNSEVCDCAADVDSWNAGIKEARLRGDLMELLGALGDVTVEKREQLITLGS